MTTNTVTVSVLSSDVYECMNRSNTTRYIEYNVDIILNKMLTNIKVAVKHD